MLANQITSSTDTVLLNFLRSASQAGIYAAVYRIPNGWLAALALMMGSLLPMATSSHHEDREGHLQLRSRSLRLSAIGALLILAVTPLSVWLVPVLFGSSYASGRLPLAILMVATALITFVAPLHPFAMSHGPGPHLRPDPGVRGRRQHRRQPVDHPRAGHDRRGPDHPGRPDRHLGPAVAAGAQCRACADPGSSEPGLPDGGASDPPG